MSFFKQKKSIIKASRFNWYLNLDSTNLIYFYTNENPILTSITILNTN
jgi:hypothetical protein